MPKQEAWEEQIRSKFLFVQKRPSYLSRKTFWKNMLVEFEDAQKIIGEEPSETREYQ